MDERTRITDDELAPQLRRTIAPKPDVQKSRGLSKKRIGLGLIVVVLLALGVYQIARFVHTAPAPTGRGGPQGQTQSVGASTVSLHDVPVYVDGLGTVTPLATVTVQTQISGYLTDVKFNEGDMVKKGDPLAQIDQRPYDILKNQYEGQLAHDQGLLAQSKVDLTRYQTLAKQNSIATQQADDQAFLVQQYEGTVKQDQALVAAQALNIAYCNIISPVGGRVGLRLVDPGNYVTPSSATGIAVVTQLQPITVIFTIPEDDLPDVMPQLNGGGGTLQVTAFDRANQKQLAVGKVIAVDNQIDVTTGTVKVRAQFDNSDNALFPNQFVNARLLVKTLQNAVTVPTAAIQRGSPGATGSALGSYVYVINADSTVSVRQIKTGPTYTADNVNLTEVPSGLKSGERVVTDGSDRLREGMKVNVTTIDGKQVAPAAAAAGGGAQRHNGGGRRGAAGAGGQ